MPTALGARAFDVLLVLFDRRERVVSKDELLGLVWPGLVVEDNNLQQQISHLRKLLGPLVISTVARRGYRFAMPPLSAAPLHGAAGGRPTELPNLPTPPNLAVEATAAAPPNNLQRARSRFIGREVALLDCHRLLHGSRLLTLIGMGGSGKTRLAGQLAAQQLAAAQCLPTLPMSARPSPGVGGVWWVDLAPLPALSLVAPGLARQRVTATLAATLGLLEEPDTPLLARLIAHLAPHNLLIVLDNCEHVAAAAADLVSALLATCERLKIIVTSREALGLDGEQIYPVPALLLPVGTGLESVLAAEAVAMFVDRARLVLPGFVVDADNAAGIADICIRLDGIALAIELAAAWVTLLSIDEIRARLDQRFKLLTGGRHALPRQQTLQAAMHWSYDNLPPPAQTLFARLSVFAAGCTLQGACCMADETDEYAVLRLLTRLHDKSLLLVDPAGPAPTRYRMLETVRQYAQERLIETGDADRVRTRHLHFCVGLAEQAAAQLTGPQQSAWMARLRQEQDDLLAAQAWCTQAVDGAVLGLRLVGALWRYWVSSGQLARGHGFAHMALQQAALELAKPAGATPSAHPIDPRHQCRVLLGLGQTAFRMGRFEETQACAEQGLALALSAGDRAQMSLAQGLLANALSVLGQPQLALAQFEQACGAARAAGDFFQLATVLNNLAELHRSQGRLAAAEAGYQEALSIGHGLKNSGITAIVSCNLARLLVADGRYGSARLQLLECQALAQSAGLRGLGEDGLEVGASLAVGLGYPAHAALLHGASLARMQEAGARREPVDDALIAPLMAQARQALGPARFEATEAAGRALSYDASMLALKAWLEGIDPLVGPDLCRDLGVHKFF